MRSLTFNIRESVKQVNAHYHILLFKTTLPGHVVRRFRKQIFPLMAEQRDLHPSPNIIRMIKSRIMIWVGHVARIEETSIQVFGGKPRG